MFATSGDVLHMSLAIGFILLVIFLCILIFYAILIFRDITKVVDDVSEIVAKVHKTIVQPLRAIDYIIERATPYVEAIIDKKKRAKKKK
jgi:uncharacterized protein YggT (Ycf19 family)